jgi:hypothetical protein
MQLQHRTLLALAAFVMILAAGCASTPDTQGEPVSVEFRIENNRQGIGGISAYLIMPNGSRNFLGAIESNRIGAFQRTLAPGNYTLVAGRVGADDFPSDRFRVERGTAVIVWDLNANQITIGER